jgi:hypothetical protein
VDERDDLTDRAWRYKNGNLNYQKRNKPKKKQKVITNIIYKKCSVYIKKWRPAMSEDLQDTVSR